MASPLGKASQPEPLLRGEGPIIRGYCLSNTLKSLSVPVGKPRRNKIQRSEFGKEFSLSSQNPLERRSLDISADIFLEYCKEERMMEQTPLERLECLGHYIVQEFKRKKGPEATSFYHFLVRAYEHSNVVAQSGIGCFIPVLMKYCEQIISDAEAPTADYKKIREWHIRKSLAEAGSLFEAATDDDLRQLILWYQIPKGASYDFFLHEDFMIFFLEPVDDFKEAFRATSSDATDAWGACKTRLEQFRISIKKFIKNFLAEDQKIDPLGREDILSMTKHSKSFKTLEDSKSEDFSALLLKEIETDILDPARAESIMQFSFKRMIIPVGPSNFRDSWMPNLKTYIAFLHMERMCRIIVSTHKKSAMTSDAVRRRRIGRVLKKKHAFMIDIAKWGLVFPHWLISEVLDCLEPVAEKYSWFRPVLEAHQRNVGNFVVLDTLDQSLKMPERGFGLGNYNALSTLAICCIADCLDVDGVFYSDDSVWSIKFAPDLLEALADFGLPVKFSKSFATTSSKMVFMEEYGPATNVTKYSNFVQKCISALFSETYAEAKQKMLSLLEQATSPERESYWSSVMKRLRHVFMPEIAEEESFPVFLGGTQITSFRGYDASFSKESSVQMSKVLCTVAKIGKPLFKAAKYKRSRVTSQYSDFERSQLLLYKEVPKMFDNLIPLIMGESLEQRLQTFKKNACQIETKNNKKLLLGLNQMMAQSRLSYFTRFWRTYQRTPNGREGIALNEYSFRKLSLICEEYSRKKLVPPLSMLKRAEEVVTLPFYEDRVGYWKQSSCFASKESSSMTGLLSRLRRGILPAALQEMLRVEIEEIFWEDLTPFRMTLADFIKSVASMTIFSPRCYEAWMICQARYSRTKFEIYEASFHGRAYADLCNALFEYAEMMQYDLQLRGWWFIGISDEGVLFYREPSPSVTSHSANVSVPEEEPDNELITVDDDELQSLFLQDVLLEDDVVVEDLEQDPTMSQSSSNDEEYSSDSDE